MACLITIAGTSGSIQINYSEGSVENTILSEGPGTIFVPDAVTTATYTTISGDLTASSACLTITAAPTELFELTWEVANCYNPFVFNAIVADAVEIPFTETTYNTTDAGTLADVINGLNNDSIKAIAKKSQVTGNTWVLGLILQTQGITELELRLKGTEESELLYIKGTSSASVPVTYTTIEICPTIISP